jgi:molybdopterin synthase sulfur carrier subunit
MIKNSINADISIKVKYFALFRELSNVREETINLPFGSFVGQAIDKICAVHGQKFTFHVFDDNNKFRNELTLLLNGETVRPSDFQSIVLKNGDELVLLPPIGGG